MVGSSKLANRSGDSCILQLFLNKLYIIILKKYTYKYNFMCNALITFPQDISCHLQLRGKPMVRKSHDGKVFKRITDRLCQTTQDKEITFTNPTLWCPPHKMSLSSAIIEHWADYYCAGVISYALSLMTFKVSCLSVLSQILNMFCQCPSAVC